MKECYGADERQQWTNVYTLAETTHRAYIARSTTYDKMQYPLIRALKEGAKIHGEHTDVLRGDKSFGTFAITAAPFPHGHGYIIAFLVDVTKQVKAEKELFEARLTMTTVEQLQTRSKFVAITSHEIRTPVNGMIGLCDLLILEGMLNERQQEYASDIRHCAMKLSNIINQFLDFRKLDEKKVVLELVNTNIRDLIENIAKDSVKHNKRRNVNCHLSIAEDLPEFILCDGFRITQVVNNLLDNANKFVRESGNVQLAVHYRTTSDSNTLEFRVYNDGVSLTEETAHQIFLPFIQADAGITRDYGGSGLGLSICRELSMLMNGRVYVDQKASFGCTFVFELPVQSATGGSSSMLDTSKRLISPVFRVKHILLMEDELINQKVIQRLISRCSIKCSVASNGKEGLDMFKTDNSIEIILMDCKTNYHRAEFLTN